VRTFLSNSGFGETMVADAILAAVALTADAYRHGAARVTIRWQLVKTGVRVEVEGQGDDHRNARIRARIVHSPASRGPQREPVPNGPALARAELIS
jgi:hypothetical protein